MKRDLEMMSEELCSGVAVATLRPPGPLLSRTVSPQDPLHYSHGFSSDLESPPKMADSNTKSNIPKPPRPSPRPSPHPDPTSPRPPHRKAESPPRRVQHTHTCRPPRPRTPPPLSGYTASNNTLVSFPRRVRLRGGWAAATKSRPQCMSMPAGGQMQNIEIMYVVLSMI